MSFDTTEHVLRGPSDDGGLSLPFVRAVPRQSLATEEGAGAQSTHTVSLVFLHGASSHKEVWFPTLEYLFNLQDEDNNRTFTIIEAWVADMPSNGRAAVLNEHLLEQFPGGITGQQAAHALQVLLKSGLLKGSDVIGIGHSAGACVMIQSISGYPPDKLPYSSLILVEPVIFTPEVHEKLTKEADSHLTKIIEFARTRQDIWPDRAAAREWFAGQLPWSRWDPRVLDLYVEHALRELPTAAYPDENKGVTPATTRAAEIASYSHHEDAFEAHRILQNLNGTIPVHSVVGSVWDRIPAAVHECIVDKVKSTREVADADHHVVQEDPRGVAQAIWSILKDEYAS